MAGYRVQQQAEVRHHEYNEEEVEEAAVILRLGAPLGREVARARHPVHGLRGGVRYLVRSRRILLYRLGAEHLPPVMVPPGGVVVGRRRQRRRLEHERGEGSPLLPLALLLCRRRRRRKLLLLRRQRQLLRILIGIAVRARLRDEVDPLHLLGVALRRESQQGHHLLVVVPVMQVDGEDVKARSRLVFVRVVVAFVIVI